MIITHVKSSCSDGSNGEYKERLFRPLMDCMLVVTDYHKAVVTDYPKSIMDCMLVVTDYHKGVASFNFTMQRIRNKKEQSQ